MHDQQAITRLSELLDVTRADLNADQPALGDDKESFTYREYQTAAEGVAAGLHQLGVVAGDRVGVHLHKTAHSFIAVHGVLRAGAVMVPIDAFAPFTHAARVVADAGIQVVITDLGQDKLETFVAEVPIRGAIVRGDAQLADLASIRWQDLGELPAAVPVTREPDDDAYIIYTSGSTGTPKGIVHTNRSGLAYARLAAQEYDLTAADRLANIASLHFDQSTFELYAAPLIGAAVTVVPDVLLRFPANLSALIERDKVTVWYSVPYVIRQMVTRGALDQRDLSSLRWVLYGGESFPVAELAAFMQAVPSATISNVYGPAEVNQCAVFNLAGLPTGDAVPIGHAWGETEFVVVGEDGEPISTGSGELYVASTTMMDRYWNRPDLTEAAISTRTFGLGNAARWYRTGDLVQFDADGELVFVGRADNQVKVRGQRIELEAIDETIRSLAEVAEVAVVVEDIDAGNHLIALVELALVELALVEHTAGHVDEFDGRLVQRAVGARHSQAAVPAQVIVVDRLPRTGTDKIDRNAAREQLQALRSGTV